MPSEWTTSAPASAAPSRRYGSAPRVRPRAAPAAPRAPARERGRRLRSDRRGRRLSGSRRAGLGGGRMAAQGRLRGAGAGYRAGVPGGGRRGPPGAARIRLAGSAAVGLRLGTAAAEAGPSSTGHGVTLRFGRRPLTVGRTRLNRCPGVLTDAHAAGGRGDRQRGDGGPANAGGELAHGVAPPGAGSRRSRGSVVFNSPAPAGDTPGHNTRTRRPAPGAQPPEPPGLPKPPASSTPRNTAPSPTSRDASTLAAARKPRPVSARRRVS